MHLYNLTIYIPQKFLYNDNVIKIQEERGHRMPKLNSKFVKQLEKSDDSNLCTLYVKGDWNDADYITEDTHWELAELNKMLPYLSILVDLFAFDNDYQHRTHDYNIDIRDDMSGALERYFKRKKGFYPALLDLKNSGKAFSKKVLALSEKDFKKFYKSVIEEIKEYLPEESVEYLPSYDGWGIHTIKEVRIEYQDNKFEVQTGKTVEALAELMDRMCK